METHQRGLCDLNKFHIGPESAWFYGTRTEPIKQDSPDAIVACKFLVLTLEAKLWGRQDCAERIFALCYADGPAKDLRIFSGSNPEVAEFRSMTELLLKAKPGELPDVCDQLLPQLEAWILSCKRLQPAAHKIGVLHRLNVAKIELTRRIAGMKPERVARACQRCGAKEYPNVLLNECGHIFCKSCLALKCISSKVRSSAGCVPVKCPDEACDHILAEQEVRQAMGRDSYVLRDFPAADIKGGCAMCSAHMDPAIHVECTRNKDALYICEDCAKFFKVPIKARSCPCFCSSCRKAK